MDLGLWKQNVLKIIEEIADRDYQELAWFGKANYVSSPDEMFCTLFDDFQFDEFLVNKDIDLTEQQRVNCELLRQKMNNFSEKLLISSNPEDVIDHPDWVDIRTVANSILEKN